jgi:hypothetical protein
MNTTTKYTKQCAYRRLQTATVESRHGCALCGTMGYLHGTEQEEGHPYFLTADEYWNWMREVHGTRELIGDDNDE